jgi:hypothetical protein
MMNDMRQPSTPRIAFGLGITLFGVILLLDRLGISRAQVLMQFWPLGLVLFGALVVLQALRGGPVHRGYGRPRRSLFGLAVWVLIVGAIFSGGFRNYDGDVVRADTTNTSARPQVVSLMNRSQRSDNGVRFRGADMTAVMGGSDLDLRHAVLLPGQEATIDVLAMMGGVTLRVPDDWEVDVRVTPIMGGVRDQRWRTPPAEGEASTTTAGASAITGPPPRLIVKGFVVMGGFIIKS